VFELEPVAVEEEAFCREVAATKAGNVGGELAKATPTGLGATRAAHEFLGSRGILEGHPESEVVRRSADGQGFAHKPLVLQVADEVQGVLAGQPFAVAVVFPLGDILLGERIPAEVGLEDGLDFRQWIEPGEESLGRLAVVKAAVDLIADLVRETGDFSEAHRFSV